MTLGHYFALFGLFFWIAGIFGSLRVDKYIEVIYILLVFGVGTLLICIGQQTYNNTIPSERGKNSKSIPLERDKKESEQ